MGLRRIEEAGVLAQLVDKWAESRVTEHRLDKVSITCVLRHETLILDFEVVALGSLDCKVTFELTDVF